MTISYEDVTQTLLAGKQFTWSEFDGHASGSITLQSPNQRRLFEYLMVQDSVTVAQGDESLFSGMISAWSDDGTDPSLAETKMKQEKIKDIWKLDRIEASGFGGLTLYGGPIFQLQVDGKNWCLNGQNGSGKTSIVSAILWALTGHRIREQDGPIEERGQRSPVVDKLGRVLGSWPSFASYPTRIEELDNTADIWVRLTFLNQNGDIATAFRKINCPKEGDPTFDVAVDPRLRIAPQLLETGLLMPVRLARIGFSDKSSSLYEAVKMLTGLDQLSGIAEGCSRFTHRGQRFLRYGKENGIDVWKNKFNDEISKAVKKANELQLTLPDNYHLGSDFLVDNLRNAASSASDLAGTYLQALESDITPNIDITSVEGRNNIRRSVASAQIIVSQAAKEIVIFKALKALKDADNDPKWKELPEAISESHMKIASAINWHTKQIADKKFRLKALAAQYYVPPHEHSDFGLCPLCDGLLSTKEQQELAIQLAEIKKDAKEAERRLDDVCRSLEDELMGYFPQSLKQYGDILEGMEPNEAYGNAVRERFCEQSPFSDVLLGLSSRNKIKIKAQQVSLPTFDFDELERQKNEEPPSVIRLRQKLYSFERLYSLVTWWVENRDKFLEAFRELIGIQQEGREFSPDSVAGQLQVLEDALSKATPADEFSKALVGAADAAERWTRIQLAQNVREEIAEALRPLKDLRLLVGAETARSIYLLSDRIRTILDRIHYKERLAYERTLLGKKVIHIGGSFSPGMEIDAALVANSSWLRAILWAFIFALREETIESLGSNPFPLVILDDPQTSFDPRNKRKWAQEIVRLANKDSISGGIQLFLTTHERQFYQCIVDVECLNGEQGLIGGVNNSAQVVTIVNSGFLQKSWNYANDNNDDSYARDYISDVRIYCEDLLKFMLRGEGPNISNLSLDSLARELSRLHNDHVAPFDRMVFTNLINTLKGGGGRPMKLINEAHHKDDESIGLAQAREVKDFFDDKLMTQVHDCFAVFDQYESYYGEPRTFPWDKTVVEFPIGFRDELGDIILKNSGIAAAAKTDGKAGDGVMTITEWDDAGSIVLPNHEIFQLAAGTLEPVASLGDMVIVCNHAKINSRDLVIAAQGKALLARRYNKIDTHPEIAVLTGEAVDPNTLPTPVLIARNHTSVRKIVGTLFFSNYQSIPLIDSNAEIGQIKDVAIPRRMLRGANLFRVEGRSAEPIALDGQYIITSGIHVNMEQAEGLDGRLVVAVDDDGVRYFKRLRCKGELIVLESLNQDGTTASELLSFNGTCGLPRLSHLREVIGVLFEVENM